MKKILLTIIGLAMASPAWSSQTAVTEISGVQPSVGALKTQVNTKLGTVESNRQDHETRVAAMETGKADKTSFMSQAAFTSAWGWAPGGGSFDQAGDYTLTGSWNFSGATVTGLSGGSMIYPDAGIPASTGSAWGSSYSVGTSANNLVQLNSSAQLPAVSAALLTNFPTLNQNTTGSAAKLTTARTIGGVSFDGSANINLPGVNAAGNQNTTGNAGSATVLQTARTIGGVSFNGSANINLPGVNVAGTQSTTGNAATATALAANGTNCSAGQAALGVDASGNAEGCWTPESGAAPPTWMPSVGPANSRQIIQAVGGCSDSAYDNQADCETNSGTWTPPYGIWTSVIAGLINDFGIGVDDLWSAAKIAAELGAKPAVIASGTVTLGTSAIASKTCATAVTVAGAGVATTDRIDWGFNGDPTSTTGYMPNTTGMLTIIAYPTAGNVNFRVCNNTGASITPGAVTLNWGVLR